MIVKHEINLIVYLRRNAHLFRTEKFYRVLVCIDRRSVLSSGSCLWQGFGHWCKAWSINKTNEISHAVLSGSTFKGFSTDTSFHMLRFSVLVWFAEPPWLFSMSGHKCGQGTLLRGHSRQCERAVNVIFGENEGSNLEFSYSALLCLIWSRPVRVSFLYTIAHILDEQVACKAEAL